MKKFINAMTMAITVSVSGSALAHGEHPKHGGIIKESENQVSFELVNKDGKAVIYVEDHGKKVATAGATGKLTVLNGKDKTEVALAPAGDNMMATKDDVKLGKGAKAIASVTFADKRTVNLRYTLK